MNFRELLSSGVRLFFDAVIPPRASERLVRDSTDRELWRKAASVRQPADADFSYLLPYRDPVVRALVWELKYHKNPRAAELAAQILVEEVLGIASEELSPPILVPVPMHSSRRRERGYNQTELLCAAVAAHCGDSVQYLPNVLARSRQTPPQQGLPRAKRLKNSKGSMSPGPDVGRARGGICIIVDDVATTGATLREARRALRAAGASEVHCLALAG